MLLGVLNHFSSFLPRFLLNSIHDRKVFVAYLSLPQHSALLAVLSCSSLCGLLDLLVTSSFQRKSPASPYSWVAISLCSQEEFLLNPKPSYLLAENQLLFNCLHFVVPCLSINITVLLEPWGSAPSAFCTLFSDVLLFFSKDCFERGGGPAAMLFSSPKKAKKEGAGCFNV